MIWLQQTWWMCLLWSYSAVFWDFWSGNQRARECWLHWISILIHRLHPWRTWLRWRMYVFSYWRLTSVLPSSFFLLRMVLSVLLYIKTKYFYFYSFTIFQYISLFRFTFFYDITFIVQEFLLLVYNNLYFKTSITCM